MSGHVTDERKCLELRGQASRREQCTTASYPGYFTSRSTLRFLAVRRGLSPASATLQLAASNCLLRRLAGAFPCHYPNTLAGSTSYSEIRDSDAKA